MTALTMSPRAESNAAAATLLVLGASKIVVFWFLSWMLSQSPGVAGAKLQLAGSSRDSGLARTTAVSMVAGSGSDSGSSHAR